MADKREITFYSVWMIGAVLFMPEGRAFLNRTIWSKSVVPHASPALTGIEVRTDAPVINESANPGQSIVPPVNAGFLYMDGAAANPRVPSSAFSVSEENYRATLQSSLASAMQPVAPGPASREYAPSRGYMPSLVGAPPLPTLNFGSGPVMNRAGPGTYSAANGDIYTQAGPNGVLNTRTGEFSPVN